jgi:hypothetical protein
MKKVFVTHEPTRWDEEQQQAVPLFDLTPAAEYGQLEVLLPAGGTLISTVPMVRVMRDRLAHFGDGDYILPVGDPASIAAASAIAAEMNHGRVKLLRWDRRAKKYIVVQLDTSGKAI